MCGYRAAASQRCNGTTHMTGVLHWTDTGSLGRTDGMKTEQCVCDRAVEKHGALPGEG